MKIILDKVGTICLYALPLTLVAMIWVDDTTFLKKLALSELILFFSSVIFYGIFFHEPKNKKNN